jgi:hypothetical protein
MVPSEYNGSSSGKAESPAKQWEHVGTLKRRCNWWFAAPKLIKGSHPEPPRENRCVTSADKNKGASALSSGNSQVAPRSLSHLLRICLNKLYYFGGVGLVAPVDRIEPF